MINDHLIDPVFDETHVISYIQKYSINPFVNGEIFLVTQLVKEPNRSTFNGLRFQVSFFLKRTVFTRETKQIPVG